jgi:hypothetical protein
MLISDDVTIAKAITLKDKLENIGARCVSVSSPNPTVPVLAHLLTKHYPQMSPKKKN